MSSAFGLGSVQSAGVDEGYNLWLLDQDRIGVMRPGDSKATWTLGVGQAGLGYTSSVICGGAAGRAYVGYLAYELEEPDHATAEEKAMGDMDVVRLNVDGTVSLEKHLTLLNSNDFHYDETRSILRCVRELQGPLRGDLYLGTNHGVTRVRGLEFSDHRHALFADPPGSTHYVIGYNYAVSLTYSGDVFLANEWKLGLLTPTAKLEEWTDFAATPWKVDTYAEALGDQMTPDFWRATAQTRSGAYYLGSKEFGLWRMQLVPRLYTHVTGLPTEHVSALQATDDGTLFIGFSDSGLWAIDAQGQPRRVTEVPDNSVRELLYDPTVSPSMLWVLTSAELWVLRGH